MSAKQVMRSLGVKKMPTWLAIKLTEYPNVEDYEVATDEECKHYWEELIPEEPDTMSGSFDRLSLVGSPANVMDDNQSMVGSANHRTISPTTTTTAFPEAKTLWNNTTNLVSDMTVDQGNVILYQTFKYIHNTTQHPMYLGGLSPTWQRKKMLTWTLSVRWHNIIQLPSKKVQQQSKSLKQALPKWVCIILIQCYNDVDHVAEVSYVNLDDAEVLTDLSASDKDGKCKDDIVCNVNVTT